ncbi:hypothetical protein D1159_05550 [Pseudoflavonifractor sp. 524-17]|uniref:hypothetical protein n=1 Tax=Pseudoflavonifractor sp. 524-17 TaxID=2304577 RepID=UPI001379539F|nr:hypothetical protein [Pseudoflavonifractor sp. 524-17]NCE64064.1 hypothetical protein [Pseudoflavonifractor sp. 524-17]
MKQKLKNAQMAERVNQLRPILSHRDKIGYVAARNFRILSECLTEYEAFRDSLIEKYGEETKDEQGRPIIGVKIDSPNFKVFCDEMAPFNEMEHEVELMTAKYTDTIGCLTGEEILGIEWMLED